MTTILFKNCQEKKKITKIMLSKGVIGLSECLQRVVMKLFLFHYHHFTWELSAQNDNPEVVKIPVSSHRLSYSL